MSVDKIKNAFDGIDYEDLMNYKSLLEKEIEELKKEWKDYWGKYKHVRAIDDYFRLYPDKKK